MKTRVKYNKCKTCENAGWSMPQCSECNRTNGYRYYRPGPPLAPNGLDYLSPENMEAVEELELVEPVEEREARWKGAGMGDYYCSLCQYTISGRTKFCPECGAKMGEWEEDGP